MLALAWPAPSSAATAPTKKPANTLVRRLIYPTYGTNYQYFKNPPGISFECGCSRSSRS